MNTPNTLSARTSAVSAMPITDLEQVYDHLAAAIDRAPAGRSELLLCKLALLLAHELGDRARFEALVVQAERDLEV